jgi:HlyD family secretion protein
MTKKKKSNNKIIYILLSLVVVLVIVLLVGKSKGWIGKEKEIEVELGKATAVTIIEKVSATGAIQPVLEVKISPEVPGEIIQLAIAEGDSVAKGDFILKIRPDNFQSALERQRAILNQQKANLADAKARMARSNASYTRSSLEFDRQQKLFEQKVISKSDYELADANFKIAQQDLESATQSVEAAKYAVQSSSASVREAEENLKLTNIKAPMDGIVSKLNVELGETVVGTSQMQGTEMLRIANLADMEVRVDVNENDIIKISLGDTAIIDVDSYSYIDKKFKGVVTQIANSAKSKVSSDAVTEFEVRIKILNESYQDLIAERGLKYPFRPGMTASVDIITEVKRDILTVPLSSVTTRKAEEIKDENAPKEGEAKSEANVSKQELDEIVFVVKEGKAVKTIVTTGISDFENIEILSGLTLGDEIVKGPFLVVSKRLEGGEAVALKKQEEKKEEN